jgi:hypothetical protein
LDLKSYWRTTLVVFALAGIVLFWLCANRLSLNADEGIYLDGALRVMHGQAPYRDFFVHTGPGSYWLYAGVFRLFGATLSHARVPVICEIAAIAAAVFFLTANLTSYAFGLGGAFVVFALETRDLGMIALNHRWDSSSMAFLAVAPAYAAICGGSARLSFAAGVLAAAAAWCTPTLGIVALAIALWMLADREIRKLLPAFIFGMTAVSLLCIGILAMEHALVPLVQHFLWTGANYSAANHVPYGWAGTGYLEIGTGLGTVGWIFYSLLLAVIVAPAVLPILTWLGWAVYFAIRRTPMQQEKPTWFLIVCSVALVASTYPRWDIGHLLYVAPISYVLAATLLYRAASSKVTAAVAFAAMVVAIFVWAPLMLKAGDSVRLETPAGAVRVEADDRKLLEMILTRVRPGESLFVFPYFATIYFLTRGVNPTHFSYLQPGLMTDADEAEALKELTADPPEWVLYNDVPPEVYLKHWPSSDPKRLRMHSIEQFLGENYRTVEKQRHRLGEFSLLRRGVPQTGHGTAP